MGLSFATFFDPGSGGNTMVLARLLNVIAMLIFLALDGHLMLIMTLAESFRILPIADAPLASGGWFLLASAGSQIFAGGLMLALPLVTTLLTLNLAMGILNRVSPQFSIFSVGFALTLLAGMGMLLLLMPHMAPFMELQFAAGFARILAVLQGLRP
jgi:flagellar biosynthetic protein FliR